MAELEVVGIADAVDEGIADAVDVDEGIAVLELDGESLVDEAAGGVVSIVVGGVVGGGGLSPPHAARIANGARTRSLRVRMGS
jgi:hypothetical protein